MKKFANKVNSARALGELLHDDQMYGEGLPYRYHLQLVYETLLDFDVTDKDLLSAAFLHDSMEDTGVSKAVIEELLGTRVADLVAAVTDAPGKTRKEKKAATYPQIRAAGPEAVILKLADRIANLTHAQNAKGLRMWKMYKKEHAEFRSQLFMPPSGPFETERDWTMLRMWNKIDDLLAKPPELPAPPPVKLEV